MYKVVSKSNFATHEEALYFLLSAIDNAGTETEFEIVHMQNDKVETGDHIFKIGDHVTHNEEYIEAGVEDQPNPEEFFIDGIIKELHKDGIVRLDTGELINEYWLRLKE